MTDKQLLVKILDVVLKSGVCPGTNLRQWAGTLLALHKRGMLYCALDRLENVRAVWAVYRVPSWNPAFKEVMPESDCGTVAYVPFFVSRDRARNHLVRALKQYRAEHPEVTDLYFYRRNNDSDLRHYTFKTEKGSNRVLQESAHINATSA